MYDKELASHILAQVLKSAQTIKKRPRASLIKKEVGGKWPDDYFDLFGSWEGDPLERPEQGEYERRKVLR